MKDVMLSHNVVKVKELACDMLLAEMRSCINVKNHKNLKWNKKKCAKSSESCDSTKVCCPGEGTCQEKVIGRDLVVHQCQPPKMLLQPTKCAKSFEDCGGSLQCCAGEGICQKFIVGGDIVMTKCQPPIEVQQKKCAKRTEDCSATKQCCPGEGTCQTFVVGGDVVMNKCQ